MIKLIVIDLVRTLLKNGNLRHNHSVGQAVSAGFLRPSLRQVWIFNCTNDTKHIISLVLSKAGHVRAFGKTRNYHVKDRAKHIIFNGKTGDTLTALVQEGAVQ